ncbi:MAG: DUF2232 domain-containing protein [Hyphomicrobiales bacterium]
MKRGDILIGIGAGLVSAVLFATVMRASLAAFLLFCLTPLPIAIISLGWDHRAGLVASAVAALAVGLVFDPLDGVAFAVAFALPVWWLAFLALLARQGPATAAPASAMPDKQWYPLGWLAIWAAGLSVLLTLGGALMRGPDYETYRSSIQNLVQGALEGSFAGGIDELPGLGATVLSAERIARIVAAVIVPSSAAASTLLTLVIMLVAAKLVSLSGRLPRPLPRIARDFVLPRAALIGLAGSAALAPLPGWPRFVAIAVAATIAILLAMQGLATAHVLVARIPARPLILGVGYAMLVVAEPWMIVGFALLGLVEMAISLRARSLARSARPTLH